MSITRRKKDFQKNIRTVQKKSQTPCVRSPMCKIHLSPYSFLQFYFYLKKFHKCFVRCRSGKHGIKTIIQGVPQLLLSRDVGPRVAAALTEPQDGIKSVWSCSTSSSHTLRDCCVQGLSDRSQWANLRSCFRLYQYFLKCNCLWGLLTSKSGKVFFVRPVRYFFPSEKSHIKIF